MKKTKIFKVRIEPERGRPFNLYVQAKNADEANNIAWEFASSALEVEPEYSHAKQIKREQVPKGEDILGED
jgi:hypothetical protein